MYDPLVVDTFLRVHATIAPVASPSKLPRQALNEITNSMQPPVTLRAVPKLEEIATSADAILTLYELARALAGKASVNDTGDLIANHLRRLVPFSQSVLYLYDPITDVIEAKHAMGDSSNAVRGLRIPLGQRLSGWVAVNRRTVMNSDPALDLGDVARTSNPRLRSCLSTPLIYNERLVGVLSLYSHVADGFDEDDIRIIEVVARHIGHTFEAAAAFDRASRRDSITGLPNLHQLEQLLESTGSEGFSVGSDVSLLFIEVADLGRLNMTHGREAGDEVLRHVVKYASSGLRVADILFRYGSHEFVALLNHANKDAAAVLADRMRANIREHKIELHDGARVEVTTEIACVSSPGDGRSLRDLVAAAHLRLPAGA